MPSHFRFGFLVREVPDFMCGPLLESHAIYCDQLRGFVSTAWAGDMSGNVRECQGMSESFSAHIFRREVQSLRVRFRWSLGRGQYWSVVRMHADRLGHSEEGIGHKVSNVRVQNAYPLFTC